tara:strand:+ start:2296 stop:2991 length:696 start_codon:yes stop_codon:yes gene_type:complete
MSRSIKKNIIGSGFIATRFKKNVKNYKRYNVAIYASGISNSLEKNKNNLKKEINKIWKFLKSNTKQIIYISTYSVLDKSRKNKPYVKNKIKIENIIKRSAKSYLIIRLPEIIGKNKNPNTLTNFFFKKIYNNKFFFLFENTKRNILDVDDAINKSTKLIKKYYKKQKTVNLLNKTFYKPEEIVKTFEKILQKKALYKKKKLSKNSFNLRNSYFINSNKNYLIKVLRKYYLK